ncbi:menaquinone biosynthesis protein [Tunturibacter empetritectus]|uniref:Chorismate dehydratase n=1 Tax=Tunturiibacter empetritectus TaxID=3069691 RepID=A0A7W8IIY8_9BACT|nr:menaquinone biosynthesis protein [Edaphobacter lichenicola]MBB5318035.1 chorismate dehydratase [Edaphobacter lichenicola]
MLRVAAINFLNPAPLMWDFEHAPLAQELAQRYSLHYTQPSQCAAELLAGRADLGLIPIAALTPELAVVPGCTIASLNEVRSIQLIVKSPNTFSTVKTVSADTASRSSLAYAEILFRKFASNHPAFLPASADPIAMLQQADAAILIGDPALLALERREQIEAEVGPCQWFDLAHEWHIRTNVPWVAAVWAVRPESLGEPRLSAAQLVEDLEASRNHGLLHIEDLVKEWAPRIELSPAVIRHYLSSNIHYVLNTDCMHAIKLFRQYAAEVDVLPALPDLRLL